MAGTSDLVCSGFIETDTYKRSKADLLDLLSIDPRELDDRLEALLWSLERDHRANAGRVGSRNLWVAVTPGGVTPLRIYLRPRHDVPTEAELLWIEERP